MSQQRRIQFDLLTNARDSLSQAIQLLAWKDIGSDEGRLKHAVVHVAHAIELILKERLRRVSPAFVWEQVDRYPSLEARTVTVDLAISRLKNIGRIPFTKDDENKLLSLRKTRNAIEHYEWRTTEREVKTIIGDALSFVFHFASEHLDADMSKDFKKDDTWRALINELGEFARAHGARIEAKLNATGKSTTCCDNCGEATIPMGEFSCELCGHWQGV